VAVGQYRADFFKIGHQRLSLRSKRNHKDASGGMSTRRTIGVGPEGPCALAGSPPSGEPGLGMPATMPAMRALESHFFRIVEDASESNFTGAVPK
jgi:hypothetical protein